MDRDQAGIAIHPGTEFSTWLAYSLSLLGILALLFLPRAEAAGSLVTDPDFVDNQFENYIGVPCNTSTPNLIAQGWTVADINRYTAEICSPLFPGGFNNSGAYVSTSNIGSVGAIDNSSDSVAQKQTSSVKSRLDEIKEEVDPRGGWGLWLAAQAGETERVSTNNEVGYDSELEGIVVGFDYRFNDKQVVGGALGITSDDAIYARSAGFLNTDSNSLTVYTTYLLSQNTYFDAYFGYAALDYENSRDLSISGDPGSPPPGGPLNGTVRSKFSGNQWLLGTSYGIDWYPGNSSYGLVAALDYTSTTIDGHDEEGSTNLELRYAEQTTESLTVTLGGNWSYTLDLGWGALIPTAGISGVFQTEDDANTSKARLINMPTVVPFLELQSDKPDTEYLLASLGLVLATNGGSQYFFTYEKIENHDFIDNWAVSLGYLTEF